MCNAIVNNNFKDLLVSVSIPQLGKVDLVCYLSIFFYVCMYVLCMDEFMDVRLAVSERLEMLVELFWNSLVRCQFPVNANFPCSRLLALKMMGLKTQKKSCFIELQ
jgi:hypothetical protein